MTRGQEKMAAPGALREVWSQSWPTVVTMSSFTVMQFVDALMVGQLGPLELAAQGNGGVWSFTIIAFVFGLLTLVNTFVATAPRSGEPAQRSGRSMPGPRHAGSRSR